VAVAIDPAAHDGSQTTAIAWLVVVSLALSVALPPILIRRLRLTGTLRTLWWVAAPVVGVWWFAHGVWRLPALYDRLISWVETVGRDRC
jgi:hypothetical protein